MTPGLFALAIFAAPQAVFPYHFEADVLGTRANFVMTAASGGQALLAWSAAMAEIARLDRVFNSRNGELDSLNQGVVQNISRELADVLDAAEAMRIASGGAFDPRPGGGGLTLDGIAKGHIVDRALAAGLAAAPLNGMLVDIGGDIACRGVGPEGDWKVGLPDPAMPFDNAPLVASVRLSGGAIATSGLGARGMQTLDPRTGRIADRHLAATVIAPSARQADALATALMVMDAQDGLALARSQGADARITHRDGRVVQTAGFIQNTLPPKSQAAKPWGVWQALTTFIAPRRVLERDPDFRSPYVAMWVTDKANKPIRTLILVGRRPDWQRDNYIWWALNRQRSLRLVEIRSVSTSLSGQYNVFWDGVDDDGKPVPLGDYIVHVETSREKGKHTYRQMPVRFGQERFKSSLPKTEEGGGINIAFDRY